MSQTERQRRGRVGIEHRFREQAGCAVKPAREINAEWTSEPQREMVNGLLSTVQTSSAGMLPL